MDPTNPRWEASERRRRRSATFWKTVVAAVAVVALSSVAVTAYRDRTEAERERAHARDDEPGIVETTAASAPTEVSAATGPLREEARASPTALPVAGASRDERRGDLSGPTTAARAEAPPAEPSEPSAASGTRVTSGELSRETPPSLLGRVPAPEATARQGPDNDTAGALPTTPQAAMNDEKGDGTASDVTADAGDASPDTLAPRFAAPRP
jgi:hypothetical protein